MSSRSEWIVAPGDGGEASPGRLGGKAHALGVLLEGGFPVPPYYVVTPEAREAGGTSAPAVAEAIVEAWHRLCPGGEPVAVRSSALEEDGVAHSFAGQLESFLDVSRETLLDRVEAVWRSGFEPRVVEYRRQRGLPAASRAPAVLVQRMVDARVSGVAFSADPVSGRRGVAVVSAVRGLGTALVSGAADADTWYVDRQGSIIRREIQPETLEHRARKYEAPALPDDEVLAVAALARRAEAFFGRPQDIEWAIDGTRLWLLQSRPVTGLAGTPDPDGLRQVWDNSNIVESYGGITQPLTFSFARRAYQEVYRQFCLVVGVPGPVVEANASLFGNMLGLIEGRVYYNLLNWYRVLALLPGFRVNRSFMETMMGVREELPADVAAAIARGGKARDALRLARSTAGLLIQWGRLKGDIERFHRLVDETLAPEGADLGLMRPDELAAYYRRLESALLTRWKAPLVNDFFAMIFFGLLRKLAGKWYPEQAGVIENRLLAGQGGMISAEPALRMREMAQAAAGDELLIAALANGTVRELAQALEERPAFRALFDAYLARFGDRCLEELKLESPTLNDDPLLLARSVAALARKAAGPDPPEPPAAPIRLKRHPMREPLFRLVLANARARVRDRENLRFERTRVFGRVRRIFLELGRRLWALDRLDDPRDVFYLEVGEVLGFVEGTASSGDLRGLVRVRRREYEEYRRQPAPPDRFETLGPVQASPAITRPVGGEGAGGSERRGLGCCPGVVRGRACVVRDPAATAIQPGAILVAERTDPGWILLFPLASGLIVERGSLLSHSAIVARELRLPAVVGLAGALDWIADGESVELDGATGIVRKLEDTDA